MRLIAALLVLSSITVAQNVQLSGGDSTLVGASGAALRLGFPASEMALSGGVIDGHVVGGMSVMRVWDGLTFTTGDTQLPFTLPTDLFSNTVLTATGLEVSRRAKNGDGWTAFGGASSLQYQEIFFFASKFRTPTVAGFFQRHLTTKLIFNSTTVASRRQTAIESLTFHPSQYPSGLTLSASGGIGSNSPFAAFKTAYKSQTLDFAANYTMTSRTFRVVALPNQSTVENIGLSGRIAWTPRHFNFTGDHEKIVSGLVSSTVNSISAGANARGIDGGATWFYGSTAGRTIEGKTAGGGVTAGLLSAHVNWYAATKQQAMSLTVAERLTRHISVNQFVTGIHSVNFGGTYHSNTATVSGGYAMTFLPLLGRFDKVLNISLSIQLPRSIRFDGGTVTTPDGKTRWTAAMNEYAVGPLELGSSQGTHVKGKYCYRGKVVDESGNPVAGTVKIGKALVFADDTGEFKLPSRHQKTQGLVVLPEEFGAPGQWVVVSAPGRITPEMDVTIVVKRV